MTTDARTEKLYLADPYVSAFEATILSCGTEPEGKIAAVLDRTYFYPESGGQPSDRGTLGIAEVVDVREDEAGVVKHYISSPVAPGRVECRVDWGRRFDHMQQHTGQHVLSRAFIEAGKLETVSFHLGEEICTIDLDGPAPADETIERAERVANEVIWANRPVVVRTGREAEAAVLRKPLPGDVTEARIVEVEGFDTIGCCGTHVKSSGEIGVIKVLRYEKTKGVHRVYFICGKRAFDDFVKKHDIVKRLANRFTTAADALEDKVEKLHSESQRLRKDFQRMTKKLVGYDADALRRVGHRQGERLYVAEVIAGADEAYLRALGSQLVAEKATVSVLGAEDGLVVCSVSADLDVDLSAVVIERARSRGGAGGGKGRFAMVRLPAAVRPADFVREVFEALKNA